MKVIKYVAWGAGGIVALVVLAIVAAVVVVDGGFVKSRAERYMKEEKQRTLKIEGTPALKLFPVFSLSLGKTSLSEPKSEKVFVSLDSMQVAVKVMPLLSRDVVMNEFALSGLKANIVRDKEGRFNFADLAGDKEDKAEAEPPKIRIAEIRIENAQIAYADEASGQRLTVGDVNVKAGGLADDQPGPLAVSATVSGRKPEIALKLQVGGMAKINLARQAFALAKLDGRVTGNADTLKGLDLRVTGDLAADRRSQEYTVDGLNLTAKGMLERDALSAVFSAPKLRVTSSKAEGQAVTGSLAVKGPGRNVDVKFRMSAVQGSANALEIPAMALDIDSNVAGDAVKGSIATPVKANLDKRTWELAKIVANLTFTSPKIPQKTVTLPINGAVRADLGKQTVNAELLTKFDESSINAKLSATKLEPLAATFDIVIDKLNLDRYLPADGGKGGKADAPIDLSPLKGKTVSGKIAIGEFTAKRVKLQEVKAEIKLAGGKLDVAPHSAKLYGGTLAGAVSADANGNRFAVKESIQNVAVGALVRDAAQKDAVEGRGNITLDLTTAGTTVPALKKALAGSARVEMKDGAVKGINLAESFRNAKSALGSKSAKSDTSKKTDFSEMSASFAIKNGVARNDDLKAAAPFARLGGAGNLDIGNNAIDYIAKATLANTSKGQGGAAAGQVAGITVPVKLSGALDNPEWAIDYTALLGGAIGGVGGVAGGAVEVLKKGTGGVTDKVRGLFGR
jgi:AsmA protein